MFDNNKPIVVWPFLHLCSCSICHNQENIFFLFVLFLLKLFSVQNMTSYKIKQLECLLVSKPFPFWWGWGWRWCRRGITWGGWWGYLWRWWRECWRWLETVATDPHLWSHPLLDQPVQQVPIPLLANHYSIPWWVHDISSCVAVCSAVISDIRWCLIGYE